MIDTFSNDKNWPFKGVLKNSRRNRNGIKFACMLILHIAYILKKLFHRS